MSYSHEDIWNAICKLRQKIHNAREAVDNAICELRSIQDRHRKLAKMEGKELRRLVTKLTGKIDRLERRVAILEEGNRDPDARPLPEETQIQILGDFILEEIPGGIVLGETVCDAATRLLKAYRTALEGVANETRHSRTDSLLRMRRFANAALKGGDND